MNILSNLVSLDLRIAENIVDMRSDFFDHFFFVITLLGSWYFVAILFVCISVLFYLRDKKCFILPFFISILGTALMSLIIKFVVGRARPEPDLSLYTEALSSFPSAHSALIVALFGFLIFCLWRFNLSLVVKGILSLIFMIFIISVGFSRVYLGVHFMTDVIAGYLTGFMWVLISLYILHKTINKTR